MSTFVLIAQDRGSDPALVAPGLGAFLVFFVLAIACVILGFSMTRRVRRSEHRNAERARTAATDGEGGPDGVIDAESAADTAGTGGAAGAAAEATPSAVPGPDSSEAPGDDGSSGAPER